MLAIKQLHTDTHTQTCTQAGSKDSLAWVLVYTMKLISLI